MDYRLGEFVRFVEEKREGYITRIINDEMIGVTGDDDFEIPVLASKVTRVYGRMEEGVESQVVAEKPIKPEDFILKGIHLAVITDPNKGSVVHFHIVNETSFQLLLSLNTEKNGKYKGFYAGILGGHSTVKVYTASLPELNNWPDFQFQISYYSTQETVLPEPLVFKEKFKAKDFSGAKKQVPLLKHQQGWLLRLDEDELVVDVEKLKESFFKPKEEKKEIAKPAKEVDLHIEKLRDDHQFLSNREMLKIQMDHFKKALDAAIVHKLPSIIFIHGVGNGTLRHEIQKVVSKHQQVKTFMDAHKEKFGYGATEVVLK
ncbi:Smr/MutS family protein [Desertivirga brevis]|uniref:Smr/MutS family protein n=1 Tax=Desertivirga brevis TaxID=2810310 RepID=UPI001A96DE79|nr:Smr/MutS family protein [Pedobacter sp. SYSU D00873]